MTIVAQVLGIIIGVISIIGTGFTVYLKVTHNIEGKVNSLIDIKLKGAADASSKKTGEILKGISDLQYQVKCNEVSRLRTTILDFSERLRTIKTTPSIYNFQNIFTCYDKYKGLGGNGYIHEEMKYISSVYSKAYGSIPKEVVDCGPK